MLSDVAVFVCSVLGSVSVLGAAPALRKPHLRRLAIRQALGTRVESAAAAVAVALAVALVVTAFVTADSIRSSLADLERQRIGPVDVSISLGGIGARDGAKRLAEAATRDSGAAALVVRSLQVSAFYPVDGTRGGSDVEVKPDVEVKAEPLTLAFDLDYREAATFGRWYNTGLPDSGPRPGSVFVSTDLARWLGVSEGTTIGLAIGGRERPYVVERVLPRVGLAGYGHEIERPAFNVFLPTGDLEEMPGRVDVLLNAWPLPTGNAEEARRAAEAVIRPIVPVLERLGQEGTTVFVSPRRADLLAAADRIGKRQLSALLQLSAFAVAGALALLVTVTYLALSARRRLVGVLRAMGARRGVMVSVSCTVSLIPAVFGVVVGTGLGVALGSVATRFVAQGTGRILGGIDVSLSIPWAAVVAAGSGAFAVTIGSAACYALVQLTSYPSELISGRERPLAIPSVILVSVGITMLVFGAAAAAVDLRTNQPTYSYLGYPISAGGLALMSLATRLRRTIPALWGLFTVAWIVYIDRAKWQLFSSFAYEGLAFFVAAALISGSIAALAGSTGIVEGFLRRTFDMAGARVIALRAALRSMSDRRTALWLVAQTTAAVVAVLAMVAGYFALESADTATLTRRLLGNWDAVVIFRELPRGASNAEEKVREAAEWVRGAATISSAVSTFRVIAGGRAQTNIYGVPQNVATGSEVAMASEEGGLLPLVGRNRQFDSDGKAWRALFERSPNGRPWAIMSRGAVDLGNVSPASAQLVDIEAGVLLDLAGVAYTNSLLPGIYVSQQTFDELMAKRPGSGNTRPVVLVQAKERLADPKSATARLQGALLEDGARVVFAEEEANRQLGTRRAVSASLRVLLYLGVVVALLAQAAMVARAVRIRLRSLAVLKALGATRWMLFRSVMIEGATTAILGATAGAVVGSVIAVRIYATGGGTPNAAVYYSAISTIAGVVVASLVASLVPALQAARAHPASLLRLPEE